MLNINFVCMGNICRSPSGEAVMNAVIEKNGLSDKIKCDSSGTLGYHTGEPADARMQRHAQKRGYNLTSRARKFVPEDFEKFDYIIAMDNANYRDITAQDVENKFSDKVFLMTEFCSQYEKTGGVPDPYYGGAEGFELVLDLIEDACKGLLEKIKKDHSL